MIKQALPVFANIIKLLFIYLAEFNQAFEFNVEPSFFITG